MYRFPLILAAFFLAACSVFAQEPDTAPPAEPAEPAEEAEKPQTVVAPGDVVVLSTGSRMTGVQVLRATPVYYEVEVVKGMAPLQIPRRQVTEVIYDDIDPARERLMKDLFPEQQEVTIASGERVTSALRDKLMAPCTAEPLSIQNRDFVEVLEEFKVKLELNLRIHPSVQELQPRRRQWTIEVAPERTLLAVLREDLVGAFDYLDVIFEGDKIIVITKEAKNATAAESPEPTEPPQTPPPND